MDLTLILPAFIAGLLTFLAPCTLPLVPGFIGFISGTSAKDLQDHIQSNNTRRKIVLNGILYVIGFSVIFVGLGIIFGLFGSALVDIRMWLTRIGGLFIIFFGLYLLKLHKLAAFQFLERDKRFHITHKLKPGTPLSSFIFGATFAFGWTPCVGPILGTILLLATTYGTIWQGAFLLLIFSLGLGLPFIAVALGMSHAFAYIKKITPFLNTISTMGGIFLIAIGLLLVTNHFAIWSEFFFDLFDWLNYEYLLQYL